MKKIISIMALVLAFALCVPVFAMAAGSPVAEDEHNCEATVNDPNIGYVDKVVTSTGTVQLVAGSEIVGGTFIKWNFEGDYKIVEGSVTDKVIVVELASDVKAVANFVQVTGDSSCEVTTNNVNAGTAGKVEKKDNVYEITATPIKGYEFVDWTIVGDYELVEDNDSGTLVIVAVKDVVKVVANFKQVDSDKDDSSSPQTGDTVVYMIVFAGLMALAGAGFAFKKVRA